MHRKVIDNPIYSNANMLKLWVHCLLKATHAEHKQIIGNQMIVLQPGQFITGREALANEFNKGVKKAECVSSITLWRWLSFFEKLEMLNIKKTTKYSVITIINWCEYQRNEQQMNNKRTTNEQQMNTNNNVNNINKKDTAQVDSLFESWWNLYGKKQDRKKCEVKFKQLLKKYDFRNIEEGTKRYLDHLANLKARGEFAPQQKNPLTFLNGENFNDEYKPTQTQVSAQSIPLYKPLVVDMTKGE